MTEDWQDRDSRSRLEMCRGCDLLIKRRQVRLYKGDGHTPYKPPKEVQHWFCRSYGLHIEFIDRILKDTLDETNEDVKKKECDRFEN